MISTGKQISVREFVNLASNKVGLTLDWRGEGENEIAIIKSVENSKLEKKNLLGKTIVEVNKRYFRPNDVQTLLGDSAKARRLLGWSPEVNLSTLIDEMLFEDAQEFIRP